MEREQYIDRISSYGCKYEATVANARLRLQMDTLGCKSQGTVEGQAFTARRRIAHRVYRSEWNVSKTAKAINISRQHLHELINKYNLNSI